jgi:transcriptional regulator of arginine metabolism
VSAVVKQERQRAIRELVARASIGSQDELVAGLAGRGFLVTQATVSRDIAELGLVKVARGDRHVYLAPEDLGPLTAAGATTADGGAATDGGLARPGRRAADERLAHILEDVPVVVRRSGLILLLVGTPGTASVVAQAIDDSSLDLQEGTLAGDDTILVLFAAAERLERWLERLAAITGRPAMSVSSALPAMQASPDVIEPALSIPTVSEAHR